MPTTSPAPTPRRIVTPELILVCGCLAGLLTFGSRSALGLFQVPMTQEHGWSREVFSTAIALQNLLWGVGQPFTGAVADRFSTGGFLGVWLGGVLYERTGSYDVVWWLSVLLGVGSALINLPIRETPVARPTAVAA